MIETSIAEGQALKQVEDAVVAVLEAQKHMHFALKIEVYLPEILRRARKRFRMRKKSPGGGNQHEC
jgi:hypothetical protein